MKQVNNTSKKQKTYLRVIPGFLITFMVITLPAMVAAQPPGMPSEPEQAPLSGLGILAAAGGAYAVKKLRDRAK